MYKRSLLIFALASFAWGEPSAFNAGKLSVDEPYGLTENEKLLLNNIKTVKNLKRDKNSINSQVENLRVNVEGLRSLLESFNSRFDKSYKVVKRLLIAVDEIEQENVTQKNSIEAIKKDLLALVEVQKENYKNIESAIKNLEKNYVTKERFDNLKADVENFRTLVLEQFKKLGSSPNNMKKTEPKVSTSNSFNKGVVLYKKGKYEEAIAAFKDSIQRNYKPATSHYYAGEAYYKLKNYRNAFKYYKESYRRYKKGKFTPKLLLHSAISLEKTGQKAQAEKFYKMVIKKFPASPAAKQADKRLHK